MVTRGVLYLFLAASVVLSLVGAPLAGAVRVLAAAPGAPQNLSPADGAAVSSLSPTLVASAFDDEDGDSHEASQWTISGHEAVTTGGSTSWAVPAGYLDYATTYQWQVCYGDNASEWSDWSSPTSFTTVAAPRADFDASPTTVEVGGSVRFTNASSGGVAPLSFHWDFGDGQTSTGQDPEHAYDAPGDYTVALTVTDAAGGADGAKGYITVVPKTAAPSVSTGGATQVTDGTATLNGELADPGTADTVSVSFEWGLDASYGQEAPAGTLTAAGAFGAAITGLAPETTYHFRAVAAGDGTAHGSDVTFTTAAIPLEPPQVATAAASSVGTTSATLNGILGDVGTAGSVGVSFEWGLDASYGQEAAAGAMTAGGAFSAAIDGLAPETTYHFRAKAVGDGTAHGGDVTFTTAAIPLEPPQVATVAASSVGTASATLNGNLGDLGTAVSVSVSFEWGPDTSYGQKAPAGTMTGGGAFSAVLAGLAPETTYHFRAVAVGDGTAHGGDATFTTGAIPPEPPEVSTAAASGVGPDSATLNLSVTGLGTAPSVQVSFEWGLTAGYGQSTPARAADGPGAFSYALSGLEPETTYHFRARAVGDGTAYGSDVSFTTEAEPDEAPQVATVAATSVGTASATINLNLTSLGSAASVQVSFEWGLSAQYDRTTMPQAAARTGAYSFVLSGLDPDTTYHFRAVAAGDGTAYGGDMSFTTAATPAAPPTVVTGEATLIGTTSATLSLELTGLGSAAAVQVSFEWGPTAQYGSATAASAMEHAGYFSDAVSGLAPETTYHFRAVAVGDGTAYGEDLTFTTGSTPAVPPGVATGAADATAGDSARLSGELTALGTAPSVMVSFAWGTRPGGPYSNQTPGAAMTGPGPFYFDLTGLEAGATYYFQAVGVGDGTGRGAEGSFALSGRMPRIDSLMAYNVREGQEVTVKITGSNLGQATKVDFGEGIRVVEFTVASDTEIRAVIAVGSGSASGELEVTVTTPSGRAVYSIPVGFLAGGVSGGDPAPVDGEARVHLWVYLAAVGVGLAGLGVLGGAAVWLRRRGAG